ncbi:WcaF family extracellular polysaccharide biosynthesis acetyltransferase [Solitalea sp. MAHUQ-68]|uniref:WcaF family extracellular polysaccharide biosynthesis acetyltransferase n=1 Tax=Solitalea agri TaxID=2953739 RepID=A0A9X2JDP3_9SPHI|nr:WcaF family extracellular polysaccharide biosynthesis acetyltransferase [Solitalea agri]MCO4293125.1 WcaF family extracellular polysaccharide biosynthesis acetyltransferase [Solitalea agri]
MINSSLLSTYNNKHYKPGSRLRILIWYFFNRLFFKTAIPFPSSFKVNILKIFGAEIGEQVLIKPRVNIKYPWFLVIGNYAWIGEEVWIDNLGLVKIGANVCISQGAMLLTGNHNYKLSTFDLIVGEIVLEDGVWIGARSVVCPGVICRSHSILTVNSVATKELKSNKIYQGNPAIEIRNRVIQ